MKSAAILQLKRKIAFFFGFGTVIIGKRGDCLFQIQGNAFLYQMLADERRHGEIDGGHHLVCHFHDGHFCTGGMKVLGHFQSNETGSDHYGMAYVMRLKIGFDGIGVVYVSQGKYTRRIDTGQGRFYRGSSRRQKQFVVGFFVFSSVLIAGRDGMVCRIYMDNFGIDTNIHVESFPKTVGSLNKQFFPFFDDPSNIIRKTAVRVGNIFSFFKHNDLGLFVVSSDPCCCCGASGHSAYNYVFHNAVYLMSIKNY